MTDAELSELRLHNEQRRARKRALPLVHWPLQAIPYNVNWTAADMLFVCHMRTDPVVDEIDQLLEEIQRLRQPETDLPYLVGPTTG